VLAAAVSGLVGLVVLSAVLGERDPGGVTTVGTATTAFPPVAAKSTSTVRDDLVFTSSVAATATTPATTGTTAVTGSAPAPEAGASGLPPSAPPSGPSEPSVSSTVPAPISTAAAPAAPLVTVPPAEHHAVNTLCQDGSAMTGTTFGCAANGGVARLLTDAPDDLAAFEAAPWARTDAGAAASPTDGATSCGSDAYVNSAGRCVPRPVAAPSAPSGATAECRDGTVSFSQSRSGTCSGHGGVARWL
jgi:hypothetical protein